jgi:hypothetical protein
MNDVETVKLKEELRKHALHDLFNPISEIPSGLFQRALDYIEDLEYYIEVFKEEIDD